MSLIRTIGAPVGRPLSEADCVERLLGDSVPLWPTSSVFSFVSASFLGSMSIHLVSDSDARRAISDDLDDTLVVEAAAGTGKTTELVKRLLRVLATGRAEMVEI